MANDDSAMFQRKFKKVYYEIDYLSAKISKKQGFLFFKTHVYSQADLLKSEHHEKIYSITEKIGDDANNWYKAGTLSIKGKNAYYNEKEKVEEKLHELNLDIANREPTWWESVRESFSNFVKIVMKNMPDLARTMLGRIITSMIPLSYTAKKILSLARL